nr:hypothetical protein [uncultured Tolumonas sp.]
MSDVEQKNDAENVSSTSSPNINAFQAIERLIFPNDKLKFTINWNQWHQVIIYHLKELLDPSIKLDASFLFLVDAEIQWIKQLTFTPENEVQYHVKAREYRKLLHDHRIIMCYHLIDGILAELSHSITLNSELFKHFKKITILAVLAIIRINEQNNVTEDQVIETAIRNIRLFSNDKRDKFARYLSNISFDDGIEDVITSIQDEREKCVQDNSVKSQLDNLHQILNRLYTHKAKRESSGERSSDEKDGYVERSSQYYYDDAQIDVLSDIYTGKGRKKPDAWSEEEQLGNSRARATYLISQRQAKLQDFSARAMQAKSITQSLSLRTQALPCSLSILSTNQIQRIVKVLQQRMNDGSIAAFQLMLQLLLGMTHSELLDLPTACKTISKRNVDDETRWLICRKDKLLLQRLVKVANSNAHKKLDALLPDTTLFIFLPLPDFLRSIWKPACLQMQSQEETAKMLAVIYKETGIRITKNQISYFLPHWLQSNHIDQAIAGVLSWKTAKQCAPMAYSHIETNLVLGVWQDYVASLGLSLAIENTDEAIGSRLYPNTEKFVQLLRHYQSRLKASRRMKTKPDAIIDWHNAFIRHCVLILNLSTAARPVTDMYGSRHDYCLHTRMIRISDKEARSVAAGRLIPLTNLAIQQLTLLERHLHVMVNHFQFSHPLLSNMAGRALTGEGPLLFWLHETELEDGTLSYQTDSISPTLLVQYFDNLLPLPVNWHRHAVRSHLLSQKISTVLIAAFMGHEEMGHEYTNTFSASSLQSFFEISRILDDWFSAIGLESMEGW